MDDLISRQAAIDEVINLWADKPFGRPALVEIKDCIEKLPSAQPYTDEEIQKMQDIEQAQLDKAYEMGKADAMRWIPWTSGRFPEESGTYTVTAYDGATNRVTYAKYQKRLKRWELTGARAYWRVLAWCPPPEPYKEDDNEG